MTNTEQYLARIRAAAKGKQQATGELGVYDNWLHYWIGEAISEGRISQRLIGEAAGVSQQRIAQIVREDRST